MTEPYGQQPGGQGQQPGGGYPQTPPGGYQQPGYPQSPASGFQQPAYPQAPAYNPGSGGLPQAPPDYGHSAGATRPGPTTAAAVLAFVQGGITTITTILVFVGAGRSEGTAAIINWVLGLVQTVGVVLLIMGGVQLLGGRSRVLLLVGNALEIAISAVYLIAFAIVPTFDVDAFEDLKAGLIAIAIFFAVMPTISLIMAGGGATSQFLRARRGH